MNKEKIFSRIPNLDYSELDFLVPLTEGFSDEQLDTFARIYSERRRNKDLILILTVVGFFGLAGLQRFIVNQIGMGILYLLTGGLCLIGTIYDLVNYQNIAYDYNHQMAREARDMTRGIYN